MLPNATTFLLMDTEIFESNYNAVNWRTVGLTQHTTGMTGGVGVAIC
jgi:hypothetical protein